MVERFGRYKVTGKLGAGGMGEVYAAVDEVLGRQVAIKTLRSQRSGLGAHLLDERFKLEARAIATLTHPGIVQVFDIDLSANPPFLVMERVTGPSLKERLEQGPMTAREVREMGIQIARALAAAHAAGIVHRDVKPANILIAGAGTWKLVDFGVAHVPDSSLTMTGQFIGSPAYAAPEALVGGKSLPAGDIFGLGATLYLAVTGAWPRGEGPTSAPLAPIPSVRELAPSIDAPLADAIDRAVALEHERRPTAAQLAEALERQPPAERPAAAETVFVPDDAGRKPRRWKPLALAGAGVLLLGAAIAIGTLTRSKKAHAPTSSDSGVVAIADAAVDDALELDAEEANVGIDAAVPIQDPPPGQFQLRTPPLPANPQAGKEWRALADAIYERRLDEAREKLDEWEMKWGVFDETRSLRRQIDAAR